MAYCDRCERGFNSLHGLQRHEADSPKHHICDDCDMDFATWVGLEQHWIQSGRHAYCRICQEHFNGDEDLDDHYDEAHYPCKSCNKLFNNERGLHEHNRQKHWYCIDCRRLFQSQSNLNSHLNSSTHKPKDIVCPGKDCGGRFVSVSALLLHFEAGRCSSGMTRDKLNRYIVQWDRSNVITNPSRLIAGPAGTYQVPAVTETWASERSWNGYGYECFLCHNVFGTLVALNSHLKSPRHQDRIYRCPNRTTCGAEFSVMSSLTQHVESDKCGVHRFTEVKSAMDSLVGGMRRLGM
ncbi:hypothetical protein M422DRAFT_224621 [Sphaerobolus stellatus SS14]|nr:hypothetical protein M422DRAFT_224621 [Sphaerobolus stellatus SS14]